MVRKLAMSSQRMVRKLAEDDQEGNRLSGLVDKQHGTFL
jgi:hypothetical protein